MDNNFIDNLIKTGERTQVDFKAIQYWDKAKKKTNETTIDFIKDLLCFSNTSNYIQKFIFFGVNKTGKVEGLIEDPLDDADLQQIARNYIEPLPKFTYYGYAYSPSIKIAILEINTDADSMPFLLKKDLYDSKGNLVLKEGYMGLRHGSKNSDFTRNDLDEIYMKKYQGLGRSHLIMELEDDLTELFDNYSADKHIFPTFYLLEDFPDSLLTYKNPRVSLDSFRKDIKSKLSVFAVKLFGTNAIRTEQMNSYKFHLTPNTKEYKILNHIQEEFTSLKNFPQAKEAFSEIESGNLTISGIAAIWLWKKTKKLMPIVATYIKYLKTQDIKILDAISEDDVDREYMSGLKKSQDEITIDQVEEWLKRNKIDFL